MVVHTGTALENDISHMCDYVSMNLDRLEYQYTCYHYPLSVLGTSLLKYLATISKEIPKQSYTVNLLSADATEYEDTELAANPVLNWSF